MTARTHDFFAFASLITVASYYPPLVLNITTLIVSLIGNVIGALLPDIDQASNRLWDLLPGGDYLGKVLKNIFLSHRTISHSLLGIFLLSKILGWLTPKILNPSLIDVQIVNWSIIIGSVSHLIADAFTEEGLPLFFPFKLKIGFPPVASWRIKTGKWFEEFVIFPGIVLYIFWFVINHQEKILRVFRLAVQ
ncbi:metal-dependent hydrolase [Patescibacteria group bacterium]|nr:metal-dependent hydrolase [Patescibacteria group bacterium]